MRRLSFATRTPSSPTHTRAMWLFGFFAFGFGIVIVRLYYWQSIQGERLRAQATAQYSRIVTIPPRRGKISTSDGFTLVTNRRAYHLIFQPQLSNQNLEDTAELIARALTQVQATAQVGDPEFSLSEVEKTQKETLLKRMNRPDARWIVIMPEISEAEKLAVQALNLRSLVFEPFEVREYPEASMAAHILGFVGQDVDGKPQGYFGIEGDMNNSLRGQERRTSFFLDGLGFRTFLGPSKSASSDMGQDVVLTIRRDIQHLLETKLAEAAHEYQAKSGEIVVMEPATGRILGMATYPAYDPANYRDYTQELYKNPAVAAAFEPGSIFKVLTVAAGIDTGVLDGNTICPRCSGPRQFGEYSIKTFNEEYHPNITIRDGLAKSDNVAMVYASELIGKQKFLEYVQKFGIGEKIGFEIQEDTPTILKKEWHPLDVATTSFGQGVLTTSVQMVRAIGAIANQGKMMKPQIVSKIIDPDSGHEDIRGSEVLRQVISPQAALQTSEIMEYATQTALYKWVEHADHSVAGKTGTAQIFVDGEYGFDQTVTSYIGFAPVQNPKFVMLVKLTQPQTSSWADKTAAPLWFDIASELYLLLNIPPDITTTNSQVSP